MMRYVKVHHSEQPDFVVIVDGSVPDVDEFLEAVLYGASGWSEAKATLNEAISDEKHEESKRRIRESSGTIVCPVCGEEHEWLDYRASYCDTCGTKLLPEEGNEI